MMQQQQYNNPHMTYQHMSSYVNNNPMMAHPSQTMNIDSSLMASPFHGGGRVPHYMNMRRS